MTEQELQRQRDNEEDLVRLRGFRPVDDTFMRVLFRNNLPLAEYVLRRYEYEGISTRSAYRTHTLLN